MKKKRNLRFIYGISFLVILCLEILIALFIHDDFIRPYGGDVLVTVLICCFARMIFPQKIKVLPLWVFLFASLVEIGQYFNLVSILGLDDRSVIRVILGTTYSTIDLICYAVGCALFFLVEHISRGKEG